MNGRKETVRGRILHHLLSMYGTAATATQISEALELSPATVSSELNRMHKRDLVGRIPGVGPRGGMGHFLKRR